MFRWLLRMPRFRGRGRLEGWLRKLLAPRPATVLGDISLQLDPLEYTEAMLLAGNVPEPKTLELMERLLHPGDCVVDVGSHIGLHALVAARIVGSSGRVMAIEPQPANSAKIVANAALNGFAWLQCHVAACSDHDGFAELVDQGPRDRARLTLEGDGVNDREVRFVVPTRRLEGLLDSIDAQAVRLIKVDVEGHELEVLSGLGRYWERCFALILELLPDCEPESRDRLISALSGNNFELRTVEGNEWVVGQPLVENNLLAIRSS